MAKNRIESNDNRLPLKEMNRGKGICGEISLFGVGNEERTVERRIVF